MSQVRLPPEVREAHTDRLLLPLVTGDGHSGRPQRRAMRQSAKSPAKWDSTLLSANLSGRTDVLVVPHNQRHNSLCTCVEFAWGSASSKRRR